MEQLNNAQQQAARAGDGPLAIIAGPGTGKTKTLVARIRFLQDHGVPPARMLALTFTKKAAAEMRERLGNTAAYVATFHSLCFDLLRELQGEPPQFITEPARMALIKKLAKPAALKGLTVRDLSLAISRAKNLADADPHVRELMAAYNAQLGALQLYDFDDLLLRLRDELAARPAWRAAVRARFAHILIDEFQDTNLLQYDILQQLRGNDNVCVIGDPLQSIYGFRGADGDMFGRFRQDFPQAVVITLTANYRSAPAIVTLANAVYPAAPQLVAQSAAPGQAKTVEVLNEYSEAAWVLARIQQAIGGSDLQRAHHNDERRSLRDFAVVYRTRAVARAIQKACTESGIPTQIVGEGSPYEDPQVQTVLQLLARMVHADREVGIKDMTGAQVAALIAALDPAAKPLALAEHIIEQFGFAPTAHLRQLCSVLTRFATAAEAVAYFDDIATQQFYDPRAEAVTLLTIHAAKGLEFTHVFIIAAEDGVLPSTRGSEPEERRLFYVAVTRAKEQLDILHARYRGGQKATVSPFVTDIPPTVLPRHTDEALGADQRRTAKRQAKRAQTSLF